jgi:hypothetical protein
MDNINRGHSGTNRRKRARPVAKPKSGPVHKIIVDPLLWRQRLDHNPERLLWLDAVTLVVCNSATHRAYMRRVYRYGR